MLEDLVWYLLFISLVIYALAFYDLRTNNRGMKVYYYFLGLQLLLLIIYYGFPSHDNDPSHLGNAYWALFHDLCQGLVFNVLIIVFLFRKSPVPVLVRIAVLLIAVALQAWAIMHA